LLSIISGGVFIVGVEDDGCVTGCLLDKEELNTVTKAGASRY